MTGTTLASEVPADTMMVEAARRGDLIAWERLVRRYQEPVFRVAYLVVRDSDLAEDATSSTFVRAYRALPTFEQRLGLLPWLVRIAASEARQRRREASRPTRSSRPAERVSNPRFPASEAPDAGQAASLTPSERETVAEAFHRLAEEDRLVLASRYLFGLGRAEAAGALSISEGVVDERLQDALRRLRTRVAAG